LAAQTRVRVQVRPELLYGPLGDRMEKNMMMACEFVRNEVVRSLNRGQPVKIYRSGAIAGLDPSLPGEPPKKVTGFLQNSIRTRVTRTRTSITGEVGTDVKYAMPLEFGTRHMAARPFLRPAITKNGRRIFRILKSGGKALPK
jgi:HK97 gp10 family phage protein